MTSTGNPHDAQDSFTLGVNDNRIMPPRQFVKSFIHPKGEYSYPYQFPGSVLLVILQELLERHNPKRPLLIKPFHRIMEALAQEGIDRFEFAVDVAMAQYPQHLRDKWRRNFQSERNAPMSGGPES